MSGLGKKRQVFGSGLAVSYLDTFSKAALADLVVDLLRAANGADIDGEQLGALVSEAMDPVARARGDRFVSFDAFVARRDRQRQAREQERARFAELAAARKRDEP